MARRDRTSRSGGIGCSRRSPCSVGGGYPPTGAASEKLPASRSHRVRGQRAFPETPGGRKEDSGAGRFRSLRGTPVVGSQPRGLQNSCPESMHTTRKIVQNVDSDQWAARHSHYYQDLEAQSGTECHFMLQVTHHSKWPHMEASCVWLASKSSAIFRFAFQRPNGFDASCSFLSLDPSLWILASGRVVFSR